MPAKVIFFMLPAVGFHGNIVVLAPTNAVDLGVTPPIIIGMYSIPLLSNKRSPYAKDFINPFCISYF